MRIYADGELRGGALRDTPCTAPRRALGAIGVGHPGAQPVGRSRHSDARRARTHAATGAWDTKPVQYGEVGAYAGFAREGAGYMAVRTKEMLVRFA